MQYLTQEDLKRMFFAATERIEKDKEKINKINVFPVPDQDTGGNLAKTLAGIKNAVDGREFNGLDEFVDVALEGALISAQGNAGVIYTGFLAGFLPTLKNPNPIDAKKITQAMREGSKRAWESLQDPKEGTILDVIDAAAEVFEEESKKEKDIIKILKEAIKKANEALLLTREKMEIFRKANVVDAGGLGYLMILESYLLALGENEKKEKEGMVSDKVRRFVQTFSHRYEVVFLIKNPKFSCGELREKLAGLGNSLEVLQVGDKIKVHIHTDDTDAVKDVARKSGILQSIHTQDMVREVIGEDSIEVIPKIGITTDEITDLTQKIIDKYQIEIVPFKMDWPEGESLPGGNIYQKMREAEKRGIKTPPKTAGAVTSGYLKAFRKQLKKFDKILCITASSKLSGAFNSACQMRKRLKQEEQERIFILDSLSGGAGQGLLVLRAIELVQEKRGIDEIITELKNTIPSIYVYGFLEDPKWIEWGGRMTSTQANWVRRLQKIGLRPLMAIIDGRVTKGGFSFGAKDISDAIFKKIKKRSEKIRKQGGEIRVVITHCDNLEEAQKLKDKLKQIKAEISFTNLACPVIGAHLGPGSMLVGWTTIENGNNI